MVRDSTEYTILTHECEHHVATVVDSLIHFMSSRTLIIIFVVIAIL